MPPACVLACKANKVKEKAVVFAIFMYEKRLYQPSGSSFRIFLVLGCSWTLLPQVLDEMVSLSMFGALQISALVCQLRLRCWSAGHI